MESSGPVERNVSVYDTKHSTAPYLSTAGSGRGLPVQVQRGLAVHVSRRYITSRSTKPSDGCRKPSAIVATTSKPADFHSSTARVFVEIGRASCRERV